MRLVVLGETGRNLLWRIYFFYPDYTVGFGISPKSAFARGLSQMTITAGGEFHSALKFFILYSDNFSLSRYFCPKYANFSENFKFSHSGGYEQTVALI